MAEIRENREYDMLDGETVQICKVKVKCTHSTGTEALYRLYGP
jgi:hypothetical protein